MAAAPSRPAPHTLPLARRPAAGPVGLRLLAWAIALIVLLPVLAIAVMAWHGSGALWPHLRDYVLMQAAAETTVLLAGTGALVIAIGTTTAWLVTVYDFPGRRILAWALALPLAAPGYIVAYAYLDLLHPVGPAQSALRALLGYARPADLILPDLRSMGGAILVFGFVLYPYVYLTVRASFLLQSAPALEAARVLGASGPRLFTQIAVPMARPAIAAGTGLALMEALGDIGASEFLGIETLTRAVYVTWATRGSVEGAAQIALAMLAPVLLLLTLEQASRGARDRAGEFTRPLRPRRLSGVRAALAALACLLPILLGFVAPASHLVLSALRWLATHGMPTDLAALAWNSARFAAVAAAFTVLAGFTLAFCQRRAAAAIPARLVQAGYAIPGTVLAVGLLGLLAGLDAAITASGVPQLRVPLLLLSTAALVIAYAARFLAIPANTIAAGYARLPILLDDAARAVGTGAFGLARRIHWPLLRPAVAAAAMLVFIECVKELPATLLLRPLNTETLATHIYGEAARGTYEDGALAALLLVAIGMLPALLLTRTR